MLERFATLRNGRGQVAGVAVKVVITGTGFPDPCSPRSRLGIRPGPV